MNFRAALVDLDGTVYRGDALIPGAERGVAALRDAGLDVLFVSNNPTKTPAAFAEKLRQLGIPATESDVLTSGVVTADYLVADHRDSRIYVIGESGLREQLLSADLQLVETWRDADVLVASIDRSFDYDTMTNALRALETENVAFVGTDPDRTIPTGDGRSVPGSGAIVGAIAATVGREPDRILGKPSMDAVRLALDRLDVEASDCLVVGDRLDTDITMGMETAMTTVLVRTGVTGDADLDGVDRRPDHVLDSLDRIERILDP